MEISRGWWLILILLIAAFLRFRQQEAINRNAYKIQDVATGDPKTILDSVQDNLTSAMGS